MGVIYIITQDRCLELKRLIREIESQETLENSVIIVFDNSKSTLQQKTNMDIVNKSADKRHIIYKYYLEVVKNIQKNYRKIFQTNDCEIGWIRNVILSYHIENYPDYDCLMLDDDLIEIDFKKIFFQANKYSQNYSTFIIGVNIYGIDTRDSICRIEKAIEYFESNKSNYIFNNYKNSLLIEKSKIDDHQTSRISGGVLLLHGDFSEFPWFPNCYNESWLFCLKSNYKGIPSFKINSPVNHLPSSVPLKTTQQIIVEQEGVFLERVLFYSKDKEYSKKNDISQVNNYESLIIEKHPKTRLKLLQKKRNQMGIANFDSVWENFCADSWDLFLKSYLQTDWIEKIKYYFINRLN
ncbi:hypothetical protein EZY14_017150 [Kordia sp. TARA_039_SRF]|nr:hypothetical protein EZY14_017150 [Kordia sp. TARA_039_SRF]